MKDLEELRLALREFAHARDWEPFHTPKNLSSALMVEAAEVAEHFQWLTGEQSAAPDAEKRAAVALELADVLIYLVRLADRLDIDLLAAARRKLDLNETRYPAEKVRGSARKYDEYGG
ncbi:MAG: nucleotide pyrophosphohydrolase [Rhodocyclaceae bacterium]